jgi:UPF0271 protein
MRVARERSTLDFNSDAFNASRGQWPLWKLKHPRRRRPFRIDAPARIILAPRPGDQALPSIDLNADLGEGFGVWRMGDDAAMLRVVTSANIACGFHAGDPDIMASGLREAKALGVAVGAHVSFPDLPGFGRRALPMSPAEIERAVAYQLGAATAMARYVGHQITFVKAHGALANLAESDAEIAGAIARAVAAIDPSLAMLAIARSAQIDACRRAKLRVAHEVFADRAYTAEGRLVSRSKPGAVIEDAAAIVARMLKMLETSAIVTQDGALLETPIDSICVHGDTPRAVDIARELRAALEYAGWRLRAFAPRE